MKKRLENGETTLDAEHNTLAKIGDVSMLRYLYREYESKDYHIRKLVLENPACPKDVVIKACEDHDWEVRKTALMREDVSNEVRRVAALREENPFVQATLKEQLGDLYPSKSQKTIVQTVMASASLAKAKPSLASRIQAAERTITIPVPANGRPTIPKNKSPEHVL